MRLANPHEGKSFDRIDKDRNGEPEYGYRHVDGSEEIVHIPTGRSNTTYYQPEKVLDPTGCDHIFQLEDMGKREVYCSTCQLPTAFIVGINVSEENGSLFIIYKGKSYPIQI